METQQKRLFENIDDYDLIVRDIADSITIREGTTLDTSLSSENWFETVWERLNENKFAMYSFYYSVIIIFLGIIYPALLTAAPADTQGVFTPAYGGGSNIYPNLRHPFGTDSVGRDILNLVVAGTYTSMLVGIFSTVIFLSIGVPMGLVAGYYGGRLEEVIMRMADFFLAIPFLLIVIIGLQVVINSPLEFLSNISSPVIILFIIGVFGWAGTTRLVNSTTKQVLAEEYIAAARTIGASDRRIISKHIFPNILAPIIVVGTLGVATGILSEAGIAFLGFGDLLSVVSWGTIISNGAAHIILHPNEVIIPGFAVFFIAMAINLLGDALRDALDPRLKK